MPEGGQARLLSRVEQGELPGVPIPADPHRSRCAPLTVALGIDIGSAGDDQTVQPAHHIGRSVPLPVAAAA